MAETEHRTTQRIIDILRFVARSPESVSLAELCRELDAPKGTLHPVLGTLAANRFLVYDERSRRYALGDEMFTLGNRFVDNCSLLEKIKTFMDAMTEKISETAYFGILTGLDVLYLVKSDRHCNFRVVSNPGNKLPAYSTGYGKALLSQFSPAQIESFYPEGVLRKLTPNTIADVGTLNAELQAIRDTGFSIEVEESTPGIRCVGVPVRLRGRIIAGISIAVPTFRYSEEKERIYKSLLKDIQGDIERTIAQHPDEWIFT